MRVVMLILEYAPIMGGAQRQLAALAPLLVERGIEVTFDASGPCLPNPIREPEDVRRLRTFDPSRELGFVGRALELTASAARCPHSSSPPGLSVERSDLLLSRQSDSTLLQVGIPALL